MESFVDHYVVLGLQSGEEALKLNDQEIRKAYQKKALELHPDKRLDDPHANEKFQRLKTSYEVLKQEKTRKLFDQILRIKFEKQVKMSKADSKRRKMISDLEKRERSAFARGEDNEIERFSRRLEQELTRIRAKEAKKRRLAATRRLCGHHSNPLLGVPLQGEVVPQRRNIADDQTHEDKVLQRVLELAAKQRMMNGD